MPNPSIAGLAPCSDTVDLGSSIGKQKQSTRGNAPSFSFGSTGRDAAMKSSLSHAEVIRMPTTLFQPHMKKVGFPAEYPSSFGKQKTSNVPTSATFHFGTAAQSDEVRVDKKLKNCADNLAKKELRWKHHVAYENRCLGLPGAEKDRSTNAPLFMQSTIRATESSPFYKPYDAATHGGNTYGKHTRYIFHDVPQCDDPVSSRYTAREKALDEMLARPHAEPIPNLDMLKSKPDTVATSPIKSIRVPPSGRDSTRAPSSGRDRPVSQRSYRSSRSRRSERSRPRTSSSSRSQRDQVQDWIQSEFGKCGDRLFDQIQDASSSIASNNKRLGTMMQALAKIEQKAR